ncbi:hypothetical protein DSM104443_03332 [Usitatibacter rugosus]|uniref:YncI copper-binding domain-containing protein n=1 Tax=Usitatibacter rugosus TaxID=2732067 RepID=A0A6M4H353_9PROT|nr:YcnI family protein [Usitatibacter rugosus]QJR12247.1 hypothetical protein DSM104443_03332 [Usitatibacter rugosus]
MGLLNRIALATVALAAATAHAHVAVEPKSSPVNSYTRLTFRVGHGCDAAATVALTVKFPEDMKTVRPQPKPGWTVEMKKEPVIEITWRGRLEADYFDDFGALVHLPSTPGIRRFAIKQECEGKSMEWTPSLDVVK